MDLRLFEYTIGRQLGTATSPDSGHLAVAWQTLLASSNIMIKAVAVSSLLATPPWIAFAEP